MSETPNTANTIKIDNLIVETNLIKDTTYIIKALEAIKIEDFGLNYYFDESETCDAKELLRDKVDPDTVEIIKKFKYIDTINYWDGGESRSNIYLYYSKELDVFLQEDSSYDSWSSSESDFSIIEKPEVIVKTMIVWANEYSDLSPEEFQKRIA